MLKRLVDLARTAIGSDPEAGPVEVFRSSLIEILKNPPGGGINLDALRARAGISEIGAARVVAELYLRFARKVAADGVITEGERKKLDGLASTLGLTHQKARSIEQIAGSEVYEEAASQAMADGVVTLEEAAHLAELRRNLLPEAEEEAPEVEAGLAAMFDWASFREVLVRDFKRLDPREFRLDSYAADAGVPPAVAAEVAEQLFARFADKVFADGVLTPEERAHLDIVATAFHIDPAWAAQVEDQARRKAYRRAVMESMADGVISPAEAARLESLRRTLRIEKSDVAQAADGLVDEAYEALIRRVVESGVADQGSLIEIERFKRGLGLSNADTNRMIRGRALGIYRDTESCGFVSFAIGVGPTSVGPKCREYNDFWPD